VLFTFPNGLCVRLSGVGPGHITAHVMRSPAPGAYSTVFVVPGSTLIWGLSSAAALRLLNAVSKIDTAIHQTDGEIAAVLRSCLGLYPDGTPALENAPK